MEYFLDVVKKYAVFSGRARRKEYWMYTLFYAIFGTVLYVLGMMTGLIFFYCIYGLALFLPSLGVTVRRLHDIGKSGWWIFISCVPVVGGILLLVWLCTGGSEAANQYGENPKMVA